MSAVVGAAQAEAVLALGREQEAELRWLLTVAAGLGWPVERLLALDACLDQLMAALRQLEREAAALRAAGAARRSGVPVGRFARLSSWTEESA